MPRDGAWVDGGTAALRSSERVLRERLSCAPGGDMLSAAQMESICNVASQVGAVHPRRCASILGAGSPGIHRQFWIARPRVSLTSVLSTGARDAAVTLPELRRSLA